MNHPALTTAIFLILVFIVLKIPKRPYVPNPLKKYPKNKECFCWSGKKAKLCCLSKVAPVIAREHAKELKNYVDVVTKHGVAIVKPPKEKKSK